MEDAVDEQPFLEKVNRPTNDTLRLALGDTWPAYERILAIAVGFKPSWNHYKSSGWMLKVADKKKALYYVVPLQGGFNVGLTVRPAERELLLHDEAVSQLHEPLADAQKYSEGFALRFQIRQVDDAQSLESLLLRVIALRGSTKG